MITLVARVHRYRPLLIIGLVYLALSFILRLVLWGRFGASADVSLLELLPILAAGLTNDAVELLYLLLPLSLYLALLPERWRQARWQRLLLAIGIYAILFGMLYLAVAEYVFFDEFDARFNLVAVDYLIYPHEVLINIWESYPVLKVVLAVTISSALLLILIRPILKMPSAAPDLPLKRRALVLGSHMLLAVLAGFGFTTDTLAFSDNRVANELAANGVSSFFQAFHTNELNYDVYYRTEWQDKALRLLADDLAGSGGTFTHLSEGRLDRRFSADPAGLGKLNVVVVVEESFGARFSGTYGAESSLTPAFDALAKQGLLFTRAYATGTRTVRGLEAITASFPPIPSESIIKRPGNEGIANWGEVMNKLGYSSSFLYGGYGYFDNMSSFYSHNGFAVSDRSDIDNPGFANIWGVADEDLFKHALAYYDKENAQGKPFFSIIMTTSNHRPYTFPEGVPGVPPEGGGRKAGVRYADYALGRFIENASDREWYGNTLFVIVADHDARVYGSAEIPLYSYEIPLLILAPGHLQPRRVEMPTSQIDIAPTVLGLLGLAYEAPFFGQNVLVLKDAAEHSILINHNHKVALYRGDELAVLGLQQDAHSYSYQRERREFSKIAEDRALLDLAVAYYQTAFELFRDHRYR